MLRGAAVIDALNHLGLAQTGHQPGTFAKRPVDRELHPDTAPEPVAKKKKKGK